MFDFNGINKKGKTPSPFIANVLANLPTNFPDKSNSYFQFVRGQILDRKETSNPMPAEVVSALKQFKVKLAAISAATNAVELTTAVEDLFVQVRLIQANRPGADADKKEESLLAKMRELISEVNLPAVYFRQKMFNVLEKHRLDITPVLTDEIAIIEKMQQLLEKETRDIPALFAELNEAVGELKLTDKRQDILVKIAQFFNIYLSDKEAVPFEPAFMSKVGEEAVKGVKFLGRKASQVGQNFVGLFRKKGEVVPPAEPQQALANSEEARGVVAVAEKPAVEVPALTYEQRRAALRLSEDSVEKDTQKVAELNGQISTKKKAVLEKIERKLDSNRSDKKIQKINSNQKRLAELEQQYSAATLAGSEAQKAGLVEAGVRIEFYFRVTNFLLGSIANWVFQTFFSDEYARQKVTLKGHFEEASRLLSLKTTVEAMAQDGTMPVVADNDFRGLVEGYNADITKRSDLVAKIEQKKAANRLENDRLDILDRQSVGQLDVVSRRLIELSRGSLTRSCGAK